MENFIKIKEAYDDYYAEFRKAGKFAIKNTEKGFWVPAVTYEVFQIFKRLNLGQYKSFIDLGSGDGKVSLIASNFTKAHGVEHDEELHKTAVEMANMLGKSSSVSFMNEDYMEMDLGAYDVMFLNPDQRNHRLERKLAKEFSGDLIVYGAEFHPEAMEKTQSFSIDGTPVTVYRNK